MSKILVVNADDFGRSRGINDGIVEAHERGIVTSASLMVRWPAAGQAAEYARSHPSMSMGLHVDLGEWAYRDEEGWVTLYEVEATDIEDEVVRQLGTFRTLIGRDPTHLDSHQHVHRDEPARTVLRDLAGELSVPLRHYTPSIDYCGGFYGQSDTGAPTPDLITADALVGLVESLPEGATELLCHPAADVDFESTYADERVRELEALCAPRVREAIEDGGIELRSFAEIASSPA
jgi:predicted glycoside hydrolase/deacetylase ChbG (UPF0249 family)